MKQMTIAVLLTMMLVACQKSVPLTETKKDPYFIRVAAPNGVTTDYSPAAIIRAVNGGQYSENEFGSLEYAGYSNGLYTINVTNKQLCGIDFTITWLNEDTTVYINGGATRTIQLPGVPKADEKIRCKPLYRCGSSGGDMGFLEVVTPVSLPVTFKYIRAEYVDSHHARVSFEISETSGIDVYYIQVSTDGIHYTNALEIKSDRVIPDRLYSELIEL